MKKKPKRVIWTTMKVLWKNRDLIDVLLPLESKVEIWFNDWLTKKLMEDIHEKSQGENNDRIIAG